MAHILCARDSTAVDVGVDLHLHHSASSGVPSLGANWQGVQLVLPQTVVVVLGVEQWRGDSGGGDVERGCGRVHTLAGVRRARASIGGSSSIE